MKRSSGHVPNDAETIALGIQQPWAELILQGRKTIEVRSQPTRVRGRIYLYASRRWSPLPAAALAAEKFGVDRSELAAGMLVGTVDLIDCRACREEDASAACLTADLLQKQYAWILANAQRFDAPHSVRFLPYGVWFYPFRRKKSAGH